jgi:putative membrane protein
MKRFAALTVIALASGLAFASDLAFAETTSEKLGVNSVLGIAPTTQDFVAEAAHSGNFEIKSSQLAEKRGDQATKTFAAKMITDHTKLNSELKDLVQSKHINVTIPDGVSSSQQAMLDKLNTLKGVDFDSRFRDDQISGHKEAVSLFERYAKGGDNADLKTWADHTIALLKEHLQMAEGLAPHAEK